MYDIQVDFIKQHYISENFVLEISEMVFHDGPVLLT